MSRTAEFEEGYWKKSYMTSPLFTSYGWFGPSVTAVTTGAADKQELLCKEEGDDAINAVPGRKTSDDDGHVECIYHLNVYEYEESLDAGVGVNFLLDAAGAIPHASIPMAIANATVSMLREKLDTEKHYLFIQMILCADSHVYGSASNLPKGKTRQLPPIGDWGDLTPPGDNREGEVVGFMQSYTSRVRFDAGPRTYGKTAVTYTSP